MSKISPTDIIESLIFASEKPVPLKKLAQILELTLEEAEAELEIVREEKARIGALQLVEVQGGWQLVTKPEFSSHIRQLRDAPRQKLSRAAFEVLAIVAYRQPCTRSDIEALRGVDCGGPVQFLLEKKLLAFAGRKETPGRPHLFATTPQFLDHFGLRDITDLPSLSELAELNDNRLINDGDALFNRGAMKSTEQAHEEAEAEMEAQDHEAAEAAAALAEAEAGAAEAGEVEAPEGETAEGEDTPVEAAEGETVTAESDEPVTEVASEEDTESGETASGESESGIEDEENNKPPTAADEEPAGEDNSAEGATEDDESASDEADEDDLVARIRAVAQRAVSDAKPSVEIETEEAEERLTEELLAEEESGRVQERATVEAEA